MTKKQLMWFGIIMGLYALAMIGWAVLMIVNHT